jgi:hypothetical protein
VEGLNVKKLRKLKGKWQFEVEYLKPFIDIESEIVDELAKQLQSEMDREILAKLRTEDTRQAFAENPIMRHAEAARHIDSENFIPGMHDLWFCLDTKREARERFKSRAQGDFHQFAPLLGFGVYDDAVLWVMTNS